MDRYSKTAAFIFPQILHSMDKGCRADESLVSRLYSVYLHAQKNQKPGQPTDIRRTVNDLPPEILRLILEYSNTCNAPGYVTLAQVIHAISRIHPSECVFNIPGLPFAATDQSPPLVALLWARRVCRLWQAISDEIIYENLEPNSWLTPALGDQFLRFLQAHLEQRERSEYCYAQTHTMTKPTLLSPSAEPSEISEVLHLIVVHHREDHKTLIRVFRQKPRLYTASPPISQDKKLWPGCDCTRPQSAGVATGTEFVHMLASDNELQKVVQLVWRTSFRMGSNQLLVGLQHLAIARRLLDV